MDNTEELRCLSFCAGYAGIERGIELTGTKVRTVAYVEIEAFPVANLVAKMESGEMVPAPVWTNLKTFPMEEFRNCVDIITGGFPCQPFSSAGKRGADEDQRHLFPYFKRAIKKLKPKFILLENVDGIASAKLSGSGWTDEAGTPVLLHVIRELERLGYRAKAGQYSASAVGAPHGRKRWFIYGELADYRSQESDGLSQPEEREKDLQARESSSTRKLGDSQNQFSERSEPIRDRGRESEKEARMPSGDRKLGNTKYNGLSSIKKLRGDEATSNDRKKKQVETRESSRTNRSIDESSIQRCPDGSKFRWPARPGREQFIWEEPRTIPNAISKGLEGQQITKGSSSDRQKPQDKQSSGCDRNSREDENRGESQHQFKPELGGATNGYSSRINSTTNRVDRLRMCGNGVVPQASALAWIDLHHSKRS